MAIAFKIRDQDAPIQDPTLADEDCGVDEIQQEFAPDLPDV